MLFIIFLLLTQVGALEAAQPVSNDELDEAVALGQSAIETVSLRSGFGVAFNPDTAFIEQLLDRVGAEPTEFLENLAPTQAVFAQANSASDSEAAITPRAQASLILAEVALARQRFDAGAEIDSLVEGMLYLASAKAQADFALVKMRDENGLFLSGSWVDDDFERNDSAVPTMDQCAMLEALSALADVTATAGPYASAYADRGFVDWFQSGATDTMGALEDYTPRDAAELSAALRAVYTYQSVASDPATLQPTIDNLSEQLGSTNPENIIDRARTVEGLIRYGPEAFHGQALELANSLIDETTAATVWPTDDLAAVISAIDALANVDGWERADEAPGVLATLADIATAASLSAPDATKAFPSEMSRQDDDWVVTDGSFDTAEAMHLARVLIGLAPEVDTELVPDDTAELTSEPSIIVIESTEFALTPATIDLPIGQEVTIRLDNAGAIPHNIRLEGLDVFVEAEAGMTSEATFTTPSESGTVSFICDLAGHADAGMIGEFRLVGDTTSRDEPVDDTEVLGVATEAASDASSLAAPLPPLDEGRSVPFSSAAIVLATGFIIGMLVFTGGMLNFTKYAERQA